MFWTDAPAPARALSVKWVLRRSRIDRSNVLREHTQYSRASYAALLLRWQDAKSRRSYDCRCNGRQPKATRQPHCFAGTGMHSTRISLLSACSPRRTFSGVCVANPSAEWRSPESERRRRAGNFPSRARQFGPPELHWNYHAGQRALLDYGSWPSRARVCDTTVCPS